MIVWSGNRQSPGCGGNRVSDFLHRCRGNIVLILLCFVPLWPRVLVKLMRRVCRTGRCADIVQRPSWSSEDNLANVRQLLVDVSIICRSDARTGIQRVVRALFQELLAEPPVGYLVRPVCGTRRAGYRYVNTYAEGVTQEAITDSDLGGVVTGNPGDIFLGLDFSSRILPRRQKDLLAWKAGGVKLMFVVYDLLPARRPDWFTPLGQKTYKAWLATMAVHADSLLCISASVKHDLNSWLGEKYRLPRQEVRTLWFHLGADFDAERSACPAADAAATLAMNQAPTILMVGTVEPRKGHESVLNAFELLWRAGSHASLVIVGKVGWCVTDLVRRLEHHPEIGKRLIWLKSADDVTLTRLYGSADGLLMASYGEGFGLPLIEAARYGTPVMARDIPVFRELAGEHVTYFSGDSADDLSCALHEWFRALAENNSPDSSRIPWQSWQQSAAQLRRCLLQC